VWNFIHCRQSYYLLVALTSEGELIFEEDGEGSASGARVSDRNFLNGARHSVYYQRDGDSAILLVGYMLTVTYFVADILERFSFLCQCNLEEILS